jgi:mannan endo-1,4-beta-mannosidase
VTGYDVFRATGASGGTFTQVGTTATTTFTDTGLAASTTYRYNVRARDAAQNVGPASGTVAVTTQSGGGGTGTCRVNYSASNWGGSNGFTGNVSITNTGTSAINGWTLAFSFASGQRVAQGWSATWNQASGSANVTAANLDWNRTIAPNTTVGIGFNGTHTGSNPAPTAFTLNGAACTVG